MYLQVKSVLDFLFGLVLFVLTIPLLIVLSVLVYFMIGSPVFFLQTRLGRNGKPFRIIKFRTMKPVTEQLKTDKDRLTKLGAVLRKTSLDELPQLINILKGEMSFIGPRPMLVEYWDYFREEERVRFDVRPGMTGYAEVIGRHELPWDDQFRLDAEYVHRLSFTTDLKIFFKTFPKVLNSRKVKSIGRKQNIRLDELRKKNG